VKQSFKLSTTQARNNAIEAVSNCEDGMMVSIYEPKRSEDASAKFHSLCGDLAKSGIQFFGKPRTKDEWKVLLISGHAKATNATVELVQGIEGELVSIRESSAQMGVKRMSSLVEYTLAFCATNNVRLSQGE